MIFHLSAITIALIIDRLIGDPPQLPHPVRWMGTLISYFEREWNRGNNRRLEGLIMLITLIVFLYFFTLLVTLFFYKFHPIAGVLAEAVLISTAIAGKSLKDAALTVYTPLEEGDIEDARKKLSYIVGRDTHSLDEREIVRGTVETVAENTSDGITAPLFWAAIGGAPLAIVYRLINTCDSMVGYKNERYADFGWASAKCDDLANWVPSRVTGAVMIVMNTSSFHSRLQAWKITRMDSRKHPSPNSGWGEAAVASILGISLGGRNYYKGIISDRAVMGKAIVQLNKDHIFNSIKIMNRTIIGFYILLLLGGMLIETAYTWIKSTVLI